jgi:hypothetical protein
MHAPDAHVLHENCETYAAPPVEKVPTGHGFAVPTPVPAGQ